MKIQGSCDIQASGIFINSAKLPVLRDITSGTPCATAVSPSTGCSHRTAALVFASVARNDRLNDWAEIQLPTALQRSL